MERCEVLLLNLHLPNVCDAGFDSKIMKNCGKIVLKKTKLCHFMDRLVLLVKSVPFQSFRICPWGRLRVGGGEWETTG